MSVEQAGPDEAEWDQAKFWHSQPETPAAGTPPAPAPATVVRQQAPPAPDPSPRRDTRALLAASAAHARSVGQRLRDALRYTSRHAAGLALGRRLRDAWRRVRPPVRLPALKGRFANGAGFTVTALVALVLVVGSVVWVAFADTPRQVQADGVPVPPPTGTAPAPDVPEEDGTPPSASPSPTPSPSMIPSPTTAPPPAPAAQPRAPQPKPPQTKAQQPKRGAPAVRAYRLVSSLSGKSVGVRSGSTANGAPIVQTSTRDTTQQWRVVNVGSGYVNLINVRTGKALDNTDGSQQDGTPMQQWAITGVGNANQQWRFTAAGDGYYLIINRASGRALDLRDGNRSDGATIQQWEPAAPNPNQRWRIVSAN